MTADDFRTLFNRDRMMPVTLMGGERTLAVGLNGEKVILFKFGEMPLEAFVADPFNGGMYERLIGEEARLLTERLDRDLARAQAGEILPGMPSPEEVERLRKLLNLGPAFPADDVEQA